MKHPFKLALCSLTILGASMAVGLADEDVAIADLPKPVSDAITQKYPNAKLMSAEKDTKDGKVCYEIEYKDGDTERKAKIWEDGTWKKDKKD